MGLLDRFRRKDDQNSRIARLLQSGRIIEGRVIEVTADEEGNVYQILYGYDVGGVQYESLHSLEAEPQTDRARYVPGAQVIIRYDPRQPANSIVVSSLGR